MNKTRRSSWKLPLFLVLVLLLMSVVCTVSYADDTAATADATPTEGYILTIYNANGTEGTRIDGTKSASAFSLRTALEDARVFVDNAFLFGIQTPATYVVEMYEDSTEDQSFEIGADVTVNGNGHKIVLAEGVVLTNNGTLNNVVLNDYVAEVAGVKYATIDEAIANWTNGTTLKLLKDVTLSDVIKLKSTEHHILDLGTSTMTAANSKNAIEIVAYGNGSAERTAITIKADANNPGGINAGKKAVVYYSYATTYTSGDDRPIIKIEGGVFNGSTSQFAFGTNVPGIYIKGTAARKTATLNVSGGTFNCSVLGSGKSKFLISGGTFNSSISSQGDSTALRLISGGRFKSLGFMTADDNNTKFWIGTAMGKSDRGVYVDADGYLVVGGPVITELSAKYVAVASNATKWSSYLKYSSAATYGLFYEDPAMAIAKHGEANVTLWEKPAVTIPDDVLGDEVVVEEIKNNTALKEYEPELPENVEELVIELKSVEDKIVYDVSPVANGTKVEPEAPITFRLPIPASVTDAYAKVYHEGDFMGIYAIKGEGNAKYIELSSADFSEYAVEPTKDAKAAIGDMGFATVADALAYAKNAGLTNVEIILVGETTADSADTFKLYTEQLFDSVTFKQADASKPYYIAGIYTGSRTNGGVFTFDGVNIVVTDQYIFEGNVKLSGNSVIKSVAEANCFIYKGITTVEPGSKLYGVIDDLRAGDLIIDGGRTDGQYNAEPDMQDAILVIKWEGDSVTVQNGAYVKVNAVNEIGRVSVVAGTSLNVYGSKFEAYQYIENNGTINLDATALITTGKLYGAGSIVIDVTGFTGRKTVISSKDLTGFTGTVTLTGNADAKYEITENGLEIYYVAVAQIGDVKYGSLEAAAEAAVAGDMITLLEDIVLSADVTLPAGITLNGNGKSISGATVWAAGDLTFVDYTKISTFNAGYNQPTITISAGACLETTSGRMVVGHGATFNIIGNITYAKTANKADLTPSLIAPGASFTGAGVTFNVTNAYVKFTAYCSSKNSSANGTFTFNVTNSIWEQSGSLVFSEPTNGNDPTVNFYLTDSVLTSTSHLVFAVSKGEIVFKNSNVNVGANRQLENRSTLTIKNGSVVYAALATSSNAKNPGKTIVDGATYITTGEFSGADVGIGTLIVQNGASVTMGNISKANVTVDVTSVLTVNNFFSDTTVTIDATAFDGNKVLVIKSANLANYTAITLTGYNSAKIVLDSEGATVINVAAKIGDVTYETFADALAAAKDGDTIVLCADVVEPGRIYIAGKAITIDLAGYVISGTCNSSQNSLVYIENGAELTVKDTVGTGKITYAAGTSNVGFTFDVKGKLVLESGIIELTGTWSIGYAVDVRPNSWGTEYTMGSAFVMNGGKILSSDGGVRVASSSAEAHKNVAASFEMNGGLIDAAWDGVFIQQSNTIYDDLSFTINGGTIESDLNPIRVYGPAPTGYVNDQNCMNIVLAGGTMTYTGTEAQAWIIKGILRVGGGSSVDTIVANGDFVVSASIAQSATAPEGFRWVETDDGYKLEEVIIVPIEYTNVGLTDSFKISFAFPVASFADLNGYYVVITKTSANDGSEETLVIRADAWFKTAIEGVDHYVVDYAGVAAKEMMDVLSVVICDADGNVVSAPKTDSIQDYAMRKLSRSTDATTLNTLLVDMLNYGAQAQIFFGYATDKLANADLTDEQQKAFASVAREYSDAMYSKTYADGCDFTIANTLILENNIQLKAGFDLRSLDLSEDAKIVMTYVNVKGITVTTKLSLKDYDYKNEVTLITCDGLTARDADVKITFELVDGENVIATFTNSVEGFVARLSETSEKADVCTALMKYCDSAAAYFAN